jgi:6-pyruvoyltetrahydropterin/6-carboxytetrahydropterin synthase
MEVTLTREFTFDAAQSIPTFPEGHKCRGLHGHTFRLQVSVTGQADPAKGIFYDHADIARAVRPLIETLDHSYLNEVEGLANPTLEMLLLWFWERLKEKLPGLSELVLFETPGAWCRYAGK